MSWQVWLSPRKLISWNQPPHLQYPSPPPHDLPPPHQKISGLQKIWRIFIYIPLFHIWKTKWTGASGAAGSARPRAIGSFPTQSLISLAPLGPPSPQVSVVLIHPVPAFIAVLAVLLGLNELSVVPAEESHLSRRDGEAKCEIPARRIAPPIRLQDKTNRVLLFFF